MTDSIWFELADCIGHALAKRWLTCRPRQVARASDAETTITPKPREGQSREDATDRPTRLEAESTPSE
jgi:hypothetical protein